MTHKVYGKVNNQTKEISMLYGRNSNNKSVKLKKLYAKDENGKSKLIYETKGLPEGYTEVKCLISDGNQYINTNIRFNASYGYDAVFEWIELPSSGNVFGSFGCGFGVTNNQWFVNFGGNVSWTTTPPTPEINKKYHFVTVFKFGDQKVSIDDVVYYSGNSQGASGGTPRMVIFAEETFDSRYNIVITGKVKIKLYSFKLYKNDMEGSQTVTTLIRDFIPCIRDSDNEPGLYDVINNVFYDNDGTGSFQVESV